MTHSQTTHRALGDRLQWLGATEDRLLGDRATTTQVRATTLSRRPATTLSPTTRPPPTLPGTPPQSLTTTPPLPPPTSPLDSLTQTSLTSGFLRPPRHRLLDMRRIPSRHPATSQAPLWTTTRAPPWHQEVWGGPATGYRQDYPRHRPSWSTLGAEECQVSLLC